MATKTIQVKAGKAHARTITVAKASKPYASKSSPAPAAKPAKPKAPKAKKGAATDDNAVIYGLLTLLALAVAIGAYVVLYGVLSPMYPGAGAALRSLVPLAVEAIMGYAAHKLIGADRTILAAAAVLVVLGCAATEIDAANTAPAVAKRERVGQVLSQPVKAAEVKSQGAANDKVGKLGNLQLAQNAGKALALATTLTDQAVKDHAAALENAKAEVPGEGRLAIELSVLGAIGSSCFMPLLELFLSTIRRRK